MYRFLMCLILVLVPFYSFALTVDEAVQLAIDSNNVIKNKMSLVDARDFEATNSKILYAPSVNLSYGYDYSWDKRTQGGNLHNGMSTANISASLNLFNGFNDKSVVEAAEYNKSIASSDLSKSQYDVTLQARTDFISVLKAQSNLQVAEEYLQLLKLQKRDAQLAADNGLIARNDLLQVDTYLASAELQRINAASALTIARQTLEKTINRPLEKNEILVEPIMNNIEIKNEDNLREIMFKNNSQIKLLEHSYKMSQMSEAISKSTLYPKIDLTASYTAWGYDNASAWKGNNRNSANAIDSDFTVGITASWNIRSVFQGHYQERGKIKETMALGYTIADTKQNMSLQLRSALETYHTSIATLKQAEISVTSAEENFRVMKNQYDQSAITITDLLNASVLLNQAKVAKSNAVYNIITSVYNIERLIETEIPVE